MDNQMDSGSLDTLNKGETLLVRARIVKNGKVELEFAEFANANKNQTSSLLARINKSDDNWGKKKPRRGWMNGTVEDIVDVFGIDTSDNAEWYPSKKSNGTPITVCDFNILNPVTVEGIRARIIFEETTEPTDYQADNFETQAKRKGGEGDYITHKGEYIFTNTQIIDTDEDTSDMHTFLEPDTAAKVKEVVEKEFDTSMML